MVRVKGKNKIFALLIVLVLGFMVYAKLSPTFTFFRPLGAISGGDSQLNAYAVTVTPLSGKICSVIFHSSFGDLQKTFNPCKFSGSFSTDTPKLAVNSVDLGGKKEARLEIKPNWQPTCAGSSCPNNFWNNPTFMVNGFLFSDYVNDDFDWAIISYKDGGLVSIEADTTSKCVMEAISKDNPACVASVNELRTGGAYCSCDGCSCYGQGVVGTKVVDKSNTFQITLGDLDTRTSDRTKVFADNIPYTFEIINPNFYTREEIARKTIPTTPHYRSIDCPLYENYTMLTKQYSSGSYISLGNFQYPVNYFCASQPVVVGDINNNEVSRRTDILEGLIAGQSYTVPIGEIWRIDYMVKANYQFNLLCKKTNVSANFDGTCPSGGLYVGGGQCEVQLKYDLDKGGCSTEAGFIQLGCDGQYLPDLHACVTQPTNRCPPGSLGEYDALGQLHCYEYKPVEDRLIPGAVFNVDKQRWEYKLLPQGQCTIVNSTFRSDLDSCQRPRPLVPECNSQEGEVLEVSS